jgi:LuxR family maltose regulon positive regulatory protein
VTTDTATTAREVTPLGDPVMIAKFLVPAPNGPMLRRRRLLERLSAAVAGSPVTLVCAPAGSGKTVLASSWVSSGTFPDPVVWISLDEDDERPGIFWTYVVTGLDRAGVDVEGVGVPRSPDSVDRSTLVRLAACLSERAHPVVLVLDNADALAGRELADDVDFLLRHTGERLRLVVLSRVDPALPLPLYRLERLVAEIRFRDLAFTLGEARELLRARSRDLSENEVHAVSERTRGWAAGLRLTGLPDGRTDTGEREPVVLADDDLAAYFRSEVLGKQPPSVRDVVLATSVVDVVPAELARHLSGSKSARVILRTLAQQAAFVEPAPGPGEVYRYHPVVRDLLVAQLRSEYPRRWRRLQLKAARWFESAGRTVEAVQQYAAAGKGDEVARLLVRADGVGRLLAGAASAPLAVACAQVPSGLPGPESAVAAAAVALLQGDLEACDKYLTRAEELAPAQPADRRPDLAAAVALTSLARVAATGAPGGRQVADAAEAAIDQLRAVRPVDAVVGALLAHGRGCVHLADGNSTRARQTLTAAARAAQDAGSPDLASACLARLALAEALLGRLGDARGTAARAAPHASGVADVALAWVASERGDLPAASTHVRRATADPLVLAAATTATVLAGTSPAPVWHWIARTGSPDRCLPGSPIASERRRQVSCSPRVAPRRPSNASSRKVRRRTPGPPCSRSAGRSYRRAGPPMERSGRAGSPASPRHRSTCASKGICSQPPVPSRSAVPSPRPPPSTKPCSWHRPSASGGRSTRRRGGYAPCCSSARSMLRARSRAGPPARRCPARCRPPGRRKIWSFSR